MSLQPDRSLRLPPAPGVLDAVRSEGGRRRRTRLAMGGSALSVAAVVLGVSLLLPGSTGSTDGPAPLPVATAPSSCPAEPPADVPEGPVGYDGGERLVPDATPQTLTLCRYRTDEDAPVEGPLQVGSGLDRIAADLALPQELDDSERICPAVLEIPSYSYLVRLTYADGRAVWVQSETGGCATTRNGDFTSSVGIGGDLNLTWTAESWSRQPEPRTSDERNCYAYDSGRAGQERQLLPEGYDDVGACIDNAFRALSAEETRRLVDALDLLGTDPYSNGCSDPPPSDEFTPVTFVARYPEGRNVHLTLKPFCDNQLDNGSLEAHPHGDVLQVLLDIAEGTP